MREQLRDETEDGFYDEWAAVIANAGEAFLVLLIRLGDEGPAALRRIFAVNPGSDLGRSLVGSLEVGLVMSSKDPLRPCILGDGAH